MANSNEKFARELSSFIELNDGALDAAIAWIKDNLQPEDVFVNDALVLWAQEQDPEDVCKVKDLELWAETNGYIKEEI